MRGTAHNADTFFQARETANPFYARVPEIVQQEMDRFADLTGRQYHLFDYYGAPDAERVVGADGLGRRDGRAPPPTAIECASAKRSACCRSGCTGRSLPTRSWRPCRAACVPSPCWSRRRSPARRASRCISTWCNTLAQAASRGRRRAMPLVIGGRYGLSSKDFNPSMAKAVFDELRKPEPRNGFTVGIIDDVSHTSLTPDAAFRHRAERRGAGGVLRSRRRRHGGRQQEQREDHRRGCRAARTGLLRLRFAQVRRTDDFASALRTAADPCAVPDPAGGLHRLPSVPVRRAARRAAAGGARRHGAAERTVSARTRCGTTCRGRCSSASSSWDCGCSSSTPRVSRRRSDCAAAPTRCCRPASSRISGVLPREQAIGHIKEAIRKSYGSKGEAVVQANFRAVDETLERLFEVAVPEAATSRLDRTASVPDHAPAFVREVTAAMLEGRGDEITGQPDAGGRHLAVRHRGLGEAQHRRGGAGVGCRGLCIQCGQCSFVCPHGVIQAKYFDRHAAERCAGRLPLGADQCARLSRCAVRPRLRDRGLHRLRAVRGGVPGGAAEVARHAGQGRRCWRPRTPTTHSSPRCR